jgi:hypothetical protein
VSFENVILQIDAEIATLQNARAVLSSSGSSITKKGPGRPKTTQVAPGVNPTKKRVLSAEARKRIADAQKKRWAAQKRADKKATAKSPAQKK